MNPVTGQMGGNPAGVKAAGKGLLSGDLTKAAVVMSGGQMLSGYAQGKSLEKQERQRRADEAAALLAYQENVGTYIGMPVYNPETGEYEYRNQSGGVA